MQFNEEEKRPCVAESHNLTGILQSKFIGVQNHSLSVSRIHNESCRNLGCLCYVISVEGSKSSLRAVRKKIVVRGDLAERLYWRYRKHNKQKPVTLDTKSRTSVIHNTLSSGEESGNHLNLPGSDDALFLQVLCKTMCRKFSSRLNSESRTVSPLLYSLWALTSSVTVELFADSLNESGVLPAYCSLDSEDQELGSLGTWEDVERSVRGGGGNPPFEKTFLRKMVDVFDSGARGTSPYCRCVLLPLGKTYGILERTSGLLSQGIMLLRIPPGSMSFKPQEGYFCSTTMKRYHAFQELGLFIWRNRPYLEKHPPPIDVELMYLHWVAVACRNPSEVCVDIQAIRMAFPPALRKNCYNLALFMNSFSCV